jgi:uncharacterized membrane protein
VARDVNKGRLEAFSDGVLAVAITLLVLDLHVSASGTDSLAHQLREEWPAFSAYVISFFVIGVIWVNHHALFVMATRVDRALQFYNLLLLFWVSTIPFTTAALADYIKDGDTGDVRMAVLLYGVSNEGMAISFFLILRHLLRRELLPRPVPPADGRKALIRFAFGMIVYPVITVVGLFSPVAMYVGYLGTIIYYVVDQTPLVADEPVEVDAIDGSDDLTDSA